MSLPATLAVPELGGSSVVSRRTEVDAFEFGLERILDGLSNMIEGKAV